MFLDSVYREKIIETVFEKTNFCFVVVDERGLVTYLNDNYCKFIDVKLEKVFGKHVCMKTIYRPLKILYCGSKNKEGREGMQGKAK